ncbi:MAG: hypothetical protein ABI885_03885 [Gammaproteobacteria bacterium]
MIKPYMTLLGLVAASAASIAHSADFRTLDYGAQCQNLPALEAAQGSTPFDAQLPSGYEYAFRGRFENHDVVFGYSCRAGALYRGAYIFDVRDQAEASALYRQLKKRVTRERGKPTYDFASNEYRQKMAAVGATLSATDTEVAFWNGKRDEAHLSVAEPSKTRGWRVSLSYTAD